MALTLMIPLREPLKEPYLGIWTLRPLACCLGILRQQPGTRKRLLNLRLNIFEFRAFRRTA